jgi:hypothetical protein
MISCVLHVALVNPEPWEEGSVGQIPNWWLAMQKCLLEDTKAVAGT